MIKLIVSDFDGTLLPYGEEHLSSDILTLLGQALDEGRAVAVSSGRTYGELYPHFGPLAERIRFICCDGAYTVWQGRTIYERQIDLSDLRFFFAEAAHGCPTILHGATRNYAVGTPPAEAVAHFSPVPVKRLTEIREKIFKITSYCHAVRLPATSGLRMHWDGGPLATAQYVNRFAHKGTALSDLQVRLIIEKYDTACLGDSDNDIPMMHGAKYAVCIGTRSESLREACNRHAATAAEALHTLLEI